MGSSTQPASVAVSWFKPSGPTVQTDHYLNTEEMLEGVLLSSGEETFKAFVTVSVPRIAKEWKKSRQYEAICEVDTDSLLHDYDLLSGVEMIANERARQVYREGWTPEHDDTHANGEMAWAAVCYAAPKPLENDPWPWSDEWDKRMKHNRMRQLQIAGALIAAELDRLQRIEAREQAKEPE